MNLTELLEKSANGIDNAVLFTEQHLPDVVHQVLMWHSLVSFIGFLIGIALLALAVFIVVRTHKSYKAKGWAYDKWDGMYSMSAQLGVLCGFIAALFGTAAVGGSLAWLQILVAPKLYLLEYAAKLI